MIGDAWRALVETETGLLVVEFDSLESDIQTGSARTLKGWAEHQDFEQKLGYTTEQPDAVVRAEPGLRMRIRSWDIQKIDE